MDKEQLEVMRHSLSHVMAQAVLKLYPNVKLAIGPAIENGFYYDFDLGEESFSKADLKKIEKEMRKLVGRDQKFEQFSLSIAEAKKLVADNPYKVEMIDDLEKEGEKEISFYKNIDKEGKEVFVDMCRGPHTASTKEVGAFKLQKVAGAYWRGDEKNKMLQRIYGLAFETREEIEDYFKMLEEAEKRDHRKLGKELDLFSFHPESPGMVFWHPKGMVIWNELEKLGKELRKKYGSVEIQTPMMAKNDMWITSGHWDHYKNDMFVFDVEDQTYCLKPMDCPFNILIYKTKPRSYRELPLRYTEIGRVFRNEKSGELNGLFRVRGITQDDAHIFMTYDQVEEEIASLIRMVKEYYAVFNLEPEFFLSTRPDDFMGEAKTWDVAESDLRKALEKEGIETYGIKEGDGAFYGPKIDVNMKDVFGRTWQVATIQLDFQLAGRFGIEYIDKTGKSQTPAMIHAAIFGSFERFTGILIEHYGGAFPVWLSPEQIRILPVSEKFDEYAKEVKENLVAKGLRVYVDNDSESLPKRIRNGEKTKIPYILVVGEKEVADKTVAVRKRGEGDLGPRPTEEFVELVVKENAEKV
ncbi:threonine--tRNA ligase [Candidatus Kuenenbacteria bacterium]|nr:threonine--tRNA ligase [Candidatus Kuenenbacteria bacterium]